MELSQNNNWHERKSLWADTFEIEKREPLTKKNIDVEVVVIGAGLAGILTAYMLQANGISTVVVEADRIGRGVTQNTTAKITSQHNLIYNKLVKDFGIGKALQYAKANEWAIDKYRQLIEKEEIDCDLMEMPAYLYTLEDEYIDIINAETEAAASLGIPATFLKEEDLGSIGWGLPFPALAAVRFDRQAQFHPLKFLKAIAKDVTVYENTRVIDVEQGGNATAPNSQEKSIIITERGNFSARHVVFACHYPFINIPGYYFARMHQERSYVIALSEASDVRGMYLGVDMQGYSFRNQGGLLILGGSSHRTGQNEDGGCYDALRKVAHKWYPQAREHYAWSAQDCITIDAVPFIGQYAENRPNWYVATGFRKWGMTHAMVSAGIISSIVAKKLGQPGLNRFLDLPEAKDNIFSPQRFSIPVSTENLWKDVKIISKALLKEAFNMPSEHLAEVQKGHGGIVEYEGEKIGVYRDEEGQIHMVDTKCRHMGCQLAWNPEELTWDCPCHGSRFDYNGNLVNGPATTNLETTGDLLK